MDKGHVDKAKEGRFKSGRQGVYVEGKMETAVLEQQ